MDCGSLSRNFLHDPRPMAMITMTAYNNRLLILFIVSSLEGYVSAEVITLYCRVSALGCPAGAGKIRFAVVRHLAPGGEVVSVQVDPERLESHPLHQPFTQCISDLGILQPQVGTIVHVLRTPVITGRGTQPAWHGHISIGIVLRPVTAFIVHDMVLATQAVEHHLAGHIVGAIELHKNTQPFPVNAK